MTIQALTHIGICVSDLEQSRAFYCDGLGFKPVTRFETDNPDTATLVDIDNVLLNCLFIERDGVRIELMQFTRPGHEGSSQCEPLNALGLTHLAFRVTDVEAILARLKKLGARFMPHTRAGSEAIGTDVVFLTDPDGVRIELINMPGDPMAPLGEPC